MIKKLHFNLDIYNKKLRVTFDTNIRTRRYDLKLEAGDYGE